ncbi:MAG: hypothetical protein ACK46I_05365, partial [Phycisphaerae bacterium]
TISRVIFEKDPKFPAMPIGEQVLVRTIVTTPAPEGDQAANAAEPVPPRVLARPVDIVQAPDGSIIFSTDLPRGRIYRLRLKQ